MKNYKTKRFCKLNIISPFDDEKAKLQRCKRKKEKGMEREGEKREMRIRQ